MRHFHGTYKVRGLPGTPAAHAADRLATLHANVPEEGQELLKHASDLLHPKEAIFSAVSPAIGTHTGPGTLGLAYITES